MPASQVRASPRRLTSASHAGMDRAALQRATAAFDPAFKWHEVEPGLEDVFIHLLTRAKKT